MGRMSTARSGIACPNHVSHNQPPNAACTLCSMTRGLDCPLILDGASLVYVCVRWRIQSYIVVVLRILYTLPAHVYPVSAVLQLCDVGRQVKTSVERVLQISNIELLERIVHLRHIACSYCVMGQLSEDSADQVRPDQGVAFAAAPSRNHTTCRH